MTKPLLSIGMIVKNEARSLEKCLKALEPLRNALPCELIIADTGSTDATREIAQRYADLVFDFPWVNDFSAARNAVMDRASGKWYFTVDADEYLDPDISQLVEFLSLPRDKQNGFAAVVQRNYHTRDMAEDDYSDFMAQRLARRDTGARYEGQIHETWPQGARIPTRLLERVILHHDGYTIDDLTAKKAKMERNLLLLRQELANHPKDPDRLLQCIESSRYHKDERMGYLYQAMEFVQGGQISSANAGCVAPLYRYAVCTALEEDLPQAEEWLAWGVEQPFFQSIICRIDVSASAAAYYHGKQDYQTALDWVERYEQGCTDYWARRYDLMEVSRSAPTYAIPNSMLFGRLLRCESLEALGRQEEALQGLEGLDLRRLCHASTLFLRTLGLLTRLKQVWEKACALYSRILSALWALDEPDNTQVQELKRACILQAGQIFQDRSGSWRLYSQAPGDLGRSARVMDLSEKKALAEELNTLECWKDVPVAVVLHAVEQGVALPAAFYQQGGERLRTIAAALGEAPTLRTYLPQWATCDDFRASMIRFQFLFQLSAAAVRGADWEGGSGLMELATLFIDLAADYLPALYHPQLLLDEGEWLVLPGLHRFALYLIRANTAFSQGNNLEYVRALKAALGAAPAMKHMVDYLLKQLEERHRQNASPELLALAEKVRAILAQYPPDDPAVAALKQSDVYQKVAYLIDGLDAPVFGGLVQ